MYSVDAAPTSLSGHSQLPTFKKIILDPHFSLDQRKCPDTLKSTVIFIANQRKGDECRCDSEGDQDCFRKHKIPMIPPLLSLRK